SPLPPSPVIPPTPPHQSPRTSPSQVAKGTSILVQQVLDKCSALVHRGRKSVDIDEGIELVDDQEKDDQEKDAQVKGRQAYTQAKIYNIDLDHTSKVATTDVSIPILAAKPVVAAAITAISAAKPKVLKSAKDKGKGILVEEPKPMKKKDQIAMDAEYARTLQEEEESQVQAKDVQPKDVPAKGIQYIRRYHGYKKKPQSEYEARKNMIDYLKNTKGFKLAFFKGKIYDQIRPIFQARFHANMRFLLKSKEEMEKEQEEIIKSINETLAQKAAKRRRLREQAKEAKDLKKQLELVADEDDDVFVKATPIGKKTA
nr:hypothetical protein [Tanacetum cinerariifolium]